MMGAFAGNKLRIALPNEHKMMRLDKNEHKMMRLDDKKY